MDSHHSDFTRHSFLAFQPPRTLQGFVQGLNGFVPQKDWSSTSGTQLFPSCAKTLAQFLPANTPGQTTITFTGPFVFPSERCALGVYAANPPQGGLRTVVNNWTNIHSWTKAVLDAVMVAKGSNVFDFAFTLDSGVKVCFYEPDDVDLNHVCSSLLTYFHTPTLIFDDCLNQQLVQRSAASQPRFLMPNSASSPPIEPSTTPTPTALSVKVAVKASTPLALEILNKTASVFSALDMLADAASGGIAFTPLDLLASATLSSRQNSTLSQLFEATALSERRYESTITTMKSVPTWTESNHVCLNVGDCVKAMQRLLVDNVFIGFQGNVRGRKKDLVIKKTFIKVINVAALGMYLAFPSTESANLLTMQNVSIKEEVSGLISLEIAIHLGGAYIELKNGLQFVLYQRSFVDPEGERDDTTGTKPTLKGCLLSRCYGRDR